MASLLFGDLFLISQATLAAFARHNRHLAKLVPASLLSQLLGFRTEDTYLLYYSCQVVLAGSTKLSDSALQSFLQQLFGRPVAELRLFDPKHTQRTEDSVQDISASSASSLGSLFGTKIWSRGPEVLSAESV